MITIRPSDERGRADHGWLQSRHTFSFAEYFDPAQMGFRVLRVINEDFVEPGRGFATHAHRDMEIVTYVVEGALEHKDSMGNGSVIRPGDVQLMRAGTGVTHSEFNPSERERVHLFQIWILPDRPGLPPAYAQQHFPAAERRNALRLVVSRDAREGSLAIAQDAEIRAGSLDAGAAVEHALKPGRCAWLQVVGGELRVNDRAMGPGDGAAIEGEPLLSIASESGAELLLFELP
jgi:redox-sensitive bicupin YhaK (pirin superfamily)